ncbi:reverse transcriptase [Plakobranchus ocellatus]|uniref:Reverse transcriptase n=1 Tax=Plakobranchus ocellatus TaxID=259542 RepID=A0AAV4CCM3_9GAST|nr:reverse transcriptase [Plakobranchus ocellatus]
MVDPQTSSINGKDARAKLPKLPKFKNENYDLDSKMKKFERLPAMSQRPQQKWASSLSALLNRRTLDCYRQPPRAQALDYDKVEKALMKRYDLTEDGFGCQRRF